MPDSTDKPPEEREPLAALHTYEPLPTHKIFPLWGWLLRFGWIGALAAAGAVVYLYHDFANPKPVFPLPHFTPASPWTTDGGLNLSPALSRDGKLVAWASDREGGGSLAIWTRPFDSGKPVRLTSGEFDETDPDFSPDGRTIAYRSERDGGGIYVQSTTGGGAPRLLAKNGRRAKFSPDGKWVAFFTLSGPGAASDSLGEIFIVPAEGGAPRRLAPSFAYARYPIWAPDGRRVLFAGIRRDGAKDWWLSPIGGGETTPIHVTPIHAREWLTRFAQNADHPDGWFSDEVRGDSIFFSGGEAADAHIWELPIRLSTLRVTGPPRRVTDGKEQEQQVATGAGGRLLFSSLHWSSDIWSLPIEANRAAVNGKLTPVTRDGLSAQLPSLAANGLKMVYVSNRSGARDIWVGDPNGEEYEVATSFLQIGYRPLLSPDAKQLVYPLTENGECTVALQDLAPNARRRQLKGCFSVSDWAPDGSSLLTFGPGPARTVELLKISTGVRRMVLSYRSGSLFGARFSPDGRWIAFAAGPTGARARVFIAPLRNTPAAEREWIAVSPDSGGNPAWSPDGNVLYFRSNRDGYNCIWAQRLGRGKELVGDPIGILHLHSALGMNFLRSTELGISVAKDRLTLNLGKMTGNLWTVIRP